MAAGLAVALSVAFLRNTAPAHEKLTAGAPSVDRQPASVRVSRRDRTSALATTSAFLHAAVLGQDPARAYELSGPEIRQGETLAQWKHDWRDPNTGVPVSPYHFREVRVKPDYSYRNRMGFQLALYPDKTERQRAMVFLIDLARQSRGKAWHVSSFVPASSPVGQRPVAGRSGFALNVTASGEKTLSALWLFVPLSVLSLIVLVPVWLGIRGYVRGRRAMRAYKNGPPLRPLS